LSPEVLYSAVDAVPGDAGIAEAVVRTSTLPEGLQKVLRHTAQRGEF